MASSPSQVDLQMQEHKTVPRLTLTAFQKKVEYLDTMENNLAPLRNLLLNEFRDRLGANF